MSGKFLFRYLCFALGMLCVLSVTAQKQRARIDSLRQVLATVESDTHRISLQNQLAQEMIAGSMYRSGDSLAVEVEKTVDAKLAGISDEKLKAFYLRAKGSALNAQGLSHYNQANMDVAMQKFVASIEVRTQLNDLEAIAETEVNLANVLSRKNDFDGALERLRRSEVHARKVDNKSMLGNIQNNMAMIFQDQNILDSSLKYFTSSLQLREEVGNKRRIAESYNNIAITYRLKDEQEKSITYLEKALLIMEEMQNKMGISVILNNMGDAYLELGKAAKAKELQLRSEKVARECNAKFALTFTLLSLARCDSALGNYGGAFDYHKKYTDLKDSIFNAESDERINEMLGKYESERKENEISILKKDNELQESRTQKQQVVIWATVFGLILALFSIFFIFNRLRVTREQKKIIESQKVQVEEKNRHITDSINYAKRIQDALLPAQEEFKKRFAEHFILFLPRDIVSGDFYWIGKVRDGSQDVIVAAADCTGHGVPGAFMSMIGNTLLNDIVYEKEMGEPAAILKALHEGVMHALHQKSSSSEDGMDISVCRIAKDRSKLIFSGASHSIYISDGKELKEYKGDPFSIGSTFGNKPATFTNQQIALTQGGMIYFSSDGFPDQIGERTNKKFLLKNLKTLLGSIASLPADAQKEKLLAELDKWKGNKAQLDDILVMGFRI